MREVDIHILYMMLFLIPLAMFYDGIWPIIIAGITPQGRLLVRAFGDYPKFKKDPWPYFIQNELVVALMVVGLVYIKS